MEEKRLIDANAFLKDILTAGIGKTIIEYSESDIAYMIRKRPTVDAVEVVRCKDCKHWFKDVAGCTDFVGRCEWANYMVGAVGYCVYGERKDGERNG